ncbi:hypothetical protein SAMN05444170_1208 [Bradyrhizobium erythrophlei]|jgi:hypothetical protein|uniref:Uncharacterized protein n=1 Tax=Bradyrhizobium erythrophlei TaxID=1437360 RepID=A0A1M7T9Y8_9BRAD|nr:hypothetical protein SAMN05444170_1208 [Bradyrhizobium erythrophlei]
MRRVLRSSYDGTVACTTAIRKWLRCTWRILNETLAHHAEKPTCCAASGERFDCEALRRGLAERGNDVIDHFLDQPAIIALAHHADHGLGAR